MRPKRNAKRKTGSGPPQPGVVSGSRTPATRYIVRLADRSQPRQDGTLKECPIRAEVLWQLPPRNGNQSQPDAFGALLAQYEPVMMTYLRREFSYDREEAGLIFRNFFLRRNLINKEFFSGLRPMRGHEFRRLLLYSLHTFALLHYRGQVLSSGACIEAGTNSVRGACGNRVGPSPGAKPEEFDIPWAATVLIESTRRMHEECKVCQKMEIWGVFNNRLRRPLLEGIAVQPYREMVNEFRLKSPIHAHTILMAAKRMFARHLEAVVGEYSGEMEATRAEITDLRNLLFRAG